MPLYGHEISDSINVFEAGHERWLKLDKGEFIGREALLAVQASGGPKRKLVAWRWSSAASPATGTPCCPWTAARSASITSGSPAPFLKTNIAFALVPAAVAAGGEDVLVQIRANRVRAKQIPVPFYKRAKK